MNNKEVVQLANELITELLIDYIKERNDKTEIAIQLNNAIVALSKILDSL